MEDLRAAYQELVAALADVMEAEDRSAGEAVARLRAAKRALTNTCDLLEHRLVAAQQQPVAPTNADGSKVTGGASDLDAFCTRLLQ